MRFASTGTGARFALCSPCLPAGTCPPLHVGIATTAHLSLHHAADVDPGPCPVRRYCRPFGVVVRACTRGARGLLRARCQRSSRRVRGLNGRSLPLVTSPTAGAPGGDVPPFPERVSRETGMLAGLLPDLECWRNASESIVTADRPARAVGSGCAGFDYGYRGTANRDRSAGASGSNDGTGCVAAYSGRRQRPRARR
jgi:hypothetical protein